MSRGDPLDVCLDPPLEPDLRERLISLWTQVSNAGGAVGFVPPVTRAQVETLAHRAFARVAEGTDHLITGARVITGAREEQLIGFLLLEHRPSPLFGHWATVKRLMVRSDLRHLGLGSWLLAGAERLARDRLGLVMLHLTVRGGTGLEAFYKPLGYQVVGRIPGAIRVAPGDDRDELHLVKRLADRPEIG